jgi:hypothetical protein
MKTLVIHPDDRTTDFLKTIYEGKDYTVITDRNIPIVYVLKQMKLHDRMIMMGHGGPTGLIGYFYLFRTPEFIGLLRKMLCICIWCNADQYVERFGITGFYTGMFISEVSEAAYLGIKTTQKEIDYSNILFVNHFRNVIDSPTIYSDIKRLYMDENSDIVKFNNERLFYTEKPVNKKSRHDLSKFQFHKLIEDVVAQIKVDIELNNTEALEALLESCDEDVLISFFPYHRMERWKKIQRSKIKY